MLDSVFISTPFCRESVAKVCLRSWNRMCPIPAASRIFSWICRKASGSYMVPVLGEGNRYGLSGCFSCSSTSRSTACFGMGMVRMELGVLGWLTFNWPLTLFTCLVTEMVWFLMSRLIQSIVTVYLNLEVYQVNCHVPMTMQNWEGIL